MHEFAITTLAAGGKGGGTRLAFLIVLLIVMAVLAAGWIICAAGARAARADRAAGRGTSPRGDYPANSPGADL